MLPIGMTPILLIYVHQTYGNILRRPPFQDLLTPRATLAGTRVARRATTPGRALPAPHGGGALPGLLDFALGGRHLRQGDGFEVIKPRRSATTMHLERGRHQGLCAPGLHTSIPGTNFDHEPPVGAKDGARWTCGFLEQITYISLIHEPKKRFGAEQYECEVGGSFRWFFFVCEGDPSI